MLKGKRLAADKGMIGCACGIAGEGRKAAGVDQELKDANRNRLRRIEGQIRGLQNLRFPVRLAGGVSCSWTTGRQLILCSSLSSSLYFSTEVN